MTRSPHRSLACLALACLASLPAAAADPSTAAGAVAVVCAPGCPYPELSREEVEDAWSGRRSQEALRSAELWDLSETDPVENAFLSKALSKDNAQYRAMWAKMVFNGRGRPPKVAADEEAMATALASNPAAIGYMALASARKMGFKILASF